MATGFDRKMAYAAVLLAFAAAMVFAFGSSTVSDADYGLLLKAHVSLETAKLAGNALFILLPLVIFAVSAYVLKGDDFYSFVAAALFIVAGANAASVYSLNPLLASALGKQYGMLNAIKDAGVLLPLGLAALLTYEYRKDRVAAGLAGAGVIFAPFAPGIALIPLSLAAAKGLEALANAPHGDKALVLAVFVFAFQGFYSGDAAAGLAAAILLSGVAYIAISLHNVKSDDVSALAMLFTAFSVLLAVYAASTASAGYPTQGELAAFGAAKSTDGTFGVFARPNAFEYYSGKRAVLLNASALLKKNATLPEFVVLSPKALDAAYADRPVFFQFAQLYTDAAYNRQYAVFSNGNGSVLQMAVSGGELAPEDALLYTTERQTVPFTKIKRLYNGSFTGASNRMVNVQEIDGSALYEVLFSSQPVFAQNGTEIARVR